MRSEHERMSNEATSASLSRWPRTVTQLNLCLGKTTQTHWGAALYVPKEPEETWDHECGALNGCLPSSVMEWNPIPGSCVCAWDCQHPKPTACETPSSGRPERGFENLPPLHCMHFKLDWNSLCSSESERRFSHHADKQVFIRFRKTTSYGMFKLPPPEAPNEVAQV